MRWYESDFWSQRVRNDLQPMQRLFYRSLLQQAWHSENPCYIPTETRRLLLMADCPDEKTWKKYGGPELMELMFSRTQDGWVNDRQLLEYEASMERANRALVNGVKGGRPQTNCETDCETETEPNQKPKVEPSAKQNETCQNQGQSQSQKYLSSNPSDSDDRAIADSKKESTRAEDEAVQEVFEYYLQKTDRNPKLYSLTPARRRKGLARLRECLKRTSGNLDSAKQLMLLCIDEMSSSDWHMGRDPKTNGTRYCEWESHLFPNAEKLEYWWNRAEGVRA